MNKSNIDRSTPFDADAEAAVLGSALLDGLRLMPVLQGSLQIGAGSFHLPAHRLVWEALESLHAEKSPFIDAVTVTSKLQTLGKLDSIGGRPFIDKLLDGTPTAAHGEYYGDLVRRKALTRRVIEFGNDIDLEARTAEDIDQLVGELSDRVMQLSLGGVFDEKTNAELIDDLIAGWVEATEHKGPTWEISLPWRGGPKSLDVLMGGLEPGLNIIAARPSVGKTTFEAAVSDHVGGVLGKRVARCTLDMTAKRLLQRSVCREAGVSAAKLRAGWANQSQMEKCRTAGAYIKTLPYRINSRDREIGVIAAWIRMQHALDPLGLFTVDFAQLVGASAIGRNAYDANARVGYVSGALKALSLDLEVPSLVLSQLSRPGASNSHKRPELQDLRDSGSLEQDASKVVFLYMNEKIHALMEKECEKVTGKVRPVWVDVMKNQDGETDRLPFWFHAQYFRFEPAEYNFGDWELVTEITAKSMNQGAY
mgnify:CR=1 FL=1